MFIGYYNSIEHSNVSNEDKHMLKDFVKLLEDYKYEPDKLVGITNDTLERIFGIAKFNPKLQIEIWRSLPNDIVNTTENFEIFEDVLENKFGEYIHGIDKKTLVDLLNNSRHHTRSNE